MMQLGPENLLSLWDKAIPPDEIPAVPGVELARAVGGERTYFIATEHAISETRSKVIVGARAAEPGELLRGPDLRFKPDWDANLKWRLKVQQALKADPRREKWMWAACKSSILFFAGTFVWIEDPWALDEESKHIPFVPFDFQADVLTWLVWCHANRYDWLIEKSREMGATWMGCIFDAWVTLFYGGTTCYWTSLRDEDVDNRNTDSLLGKYRYILRHLPDWIAHGWRDNCEGDKYGEIALPHNRSFMRGQKVESTSARGGRAFSMKADEFAHVTDAMSALEAFSSIAASCGFISTPKGMGNEFARMAGDPSIRKKTLHWSLHPLKTPEWARWERSKPRYYDDAIWDQEHEITYETSVVGRVFPKIITTDIPGAKWKHVRNDELVRYDPAYPTWTSTDFGISDPCSTLWVQIKPPPPEVSMYGAMFCIVFFDEHERRDMDALELRWLINSKGYRYRGHVGDKRSATQRDSSRRTWEINLAAADAKPRYSKVFGQVIHPGPPVILEGRRMDEKSPIETMRQLLAEPGALAISERGCPHLTRSVQQWSFPIDRETNLPRHDAGPKHDQWSHACKAALYLVDWFRGRDRPDAMEGPLEQWSFPAARLRARS